MMKRRRHETGQAMVEYALTAIVFFTMLFFILDGSRILWNYLTVSEGARVGARFATLHGSKSTAPVGPGSYTALTQTVQDSAVGLTPANLTVTATWTPNNNNPGSSVAVSVTYAVQPLTSLFWQGLTLTLGAQSVMVIQN